MKPKPKARRGWALMAAGELHFDTDSLALPFGIYPCKKDAAMAGYYLGLDAEVVEVVIRPTDYKATDFSDYSEEELLRVLPILEERRRQDAKWGPQDHSLFEWLTVLAEEVGELAAAILRRRFGNQEHLDLDWQREATQIAAVVVAMIEQHGGKGVEK